MTTTTGEPAVIYLRVAPQLRQALRRAAADAGVSMSAWAVHVLAAAVGPAALHAGSEDVGRGANGAVALPDDVPVTAEDHRRARRLAEAELTAARCRWRDEGMYRGNSCAPNDEILEWYRTVFLVRVGDPDRYKFRRSG
jgi:hypothetical protein